MNKLSFRKKTIGSVRWLKPPIIGLVVMSRHYHFSEVFNADAKRKLISARWFCRGWKMRFTSTKTHWNRAFWKQSSNMLRCDSHYLTWHWLPDNVLRNQQRIRDSMNNSENYMIGMIKQGKWYQKRLLTFRITKKSCKKLVLKTEPWRGISKEVWYGKSAWKLCKWTKNCWR